MQFNIPSTTYRSSFKIEGICKSVTSHFAMCEARDSMRNKTAGNYSRADEQVNFGGEFHIRCVTGKRLCQYRITTVFKRWPWQWHAVAAGKRKTRAKIRAWSRANIGRQSHRRSWNWHFDWGRDKNCGRSRIHVAVETRSSTSTFRFKRRDLRLDYTICVTSGFSAYQKQTVLRIRERGHRCDTMCVVDRCTWKNNKLIDDELEKIHLDCKMTFDCECMCVFFFEVNIYLTLWSW